MKRWLIMAAVTVSLVGCDSEQVESVVRKLGAELAGMTVRELGDLASRVAENPGVADSVLAANGIDIGQLDSIFGELGGDAASIGAALADLPLDDVADLADRIASDRSVADSLLTSNGVDAGQLDEVLDRIGPDAEALAAYLTSLAGEGN